MEEQMFNDSLSEAVFRQTVIDNFERDTVETCKQPDIEVSERQERRMEKLFAKEKWRKRGIMIRLWAKRLVLAVASLFIVFNGVLLTIPEVRATVADVLIKWFDEFTQFGQKGSTDNALFPNWHPSKLPEGFSKVSESQTDAIISIRYTNEEGSLILFKCVPNNDSLSVNNENVDYSQIMNDGVVYHTFTAISHEHQSAVVWDMDGFIFTVSSNLPIEQILEVAWSVKK